MYRTYNSIGKRLLVLMLAIFLGALCLSGCQGKTSGKSTSEYVFYYINQANTAVVSEDYSFTADQDDTADMIDEIITKLKENTNSVSLLKPLPDNIALDNYEYEDGVVTLYLSGDYKAMSTDQEVLRRGAIVHNLVQIPGVDGVAFVVDGEPLRDAMNRLVGTMTNDSFIDDPAKDINTIQTADLVLYYASGDGTGLVKKEETAHYNSNVPIEKVIMERLLEGPSDESDTMQSAIPAGTKLISVSVLDGVCFVSLDNGFLNPNYGISSKVVIYSIVNSLMESSNVSMVQISVNGKTDIVYRDEMSLSEYYTSNYDLVVAVSQTQETEEIDASVPSETSVTIENTEEGMTN